MSVVWEIVAIAVAGALTASALLARSPATWRKHVESLGLHWHDRERASGWLSGHYLRVWEENAETHVSIAFWPPLDFDFAELSSDPWQPAGYPDQLIARSRAPKRLRTLFGRELRQAISHIASGEVRVVLSDEDLRLVLHAIATPKQLRSMLTAGVAIAGAIDRSRERIPPPRALKQLRVEWEEVARSHGFVCTRTPVGFEGEISGIGMRGFARRRHGEWLVVVCAEFRAPLEIGFRARSRTADTPEEPWSMQAYSTGDRGFDEAFAVSAFETEYVDQALSKGARKRLCALVATWPNIVVDDYGVLIEASRRADIDRLIHDARLLAAQVDFRPPKKKSAYR